MLVSRLPRAARRRRRPAGRGRAGGPEGVAQGRPAPPPAERLGPGGGQQQPAPRPPGPARPWGCRPAGRCRPGRPRAGRSGALPGASVRTPAAPAGAWTVRAPPRASRATPTAATPPPGRGHRDQQHQPEQGQAAERGQVVPGDLDRPEPGGPDPGQLHRRPHPPTPAPPRSRPASPRPAPPPSPPASTAGRRQGWGCRRGGVWTTGAAPSGVGLPSRFGGPGPPGEVRPRPHGRPRRRAPCRLGRCQPPAWAATGRGAVGGRWRGLRRR